MRSGYVFSDGIPIKSYKTPFTGKNHGNTSLTVYARWVLGDSVLISFEDENQRNLKPNQYDTAEISDEAASHGRYSLKINKSGNTRMNASMLLLYDNQPVTVEDGATYVLTYDYRVVQNTGKGSGQTTPLPNVRGSQRRIMYGRDILFRKTTGALTLRRKPVNGLRDRLCLPPA